MKKYSLYLFDFDGTLFDTVDSLKNVYRQSFKKFGYDFDDNDCKYYLGLSLQRMLKMRNFAKENFDEFIDTFNKLSKGKQVIIDTKIYSDTKETIDYMCDHNIKFGIVTGSSYSRVLDVFKKYKLDYKKILVLIGNEEYQRPKPDKQPIIKALKKTGFLRRKNEVVFIGDAEQDLICARNAGVDYYQINRRQGNTTLENLMDLFK